MDDKELDKVIAVIRKARLRAEAKTEKAMPMKETDWSKQLIAWSESQDQAAKQTESRLLFGLCRINFKGGAARAYIPAEMARWLKQNDVSHFRAITSRDGGLIVLQPIRNRELENTYQQGRKVFETADL